MTVWLRVSDIKQYCFCRRVPYFKYVLPVPSFVSYKMKRGKKTQQLFRSRESRRTLRRYRLTGGTRRWNVTVSSEEFRLRGKLDLLITSDEGELYPVELKDTTRSFATGHKYQLVCYALLAEEQFSQLVKWGYLYSPPGEIKAIKIRSQLRDYAVKLISSVRNLIQHERLPAGSRNIARCRNCEYLRYCADRL